MKVPLNWLEKYTPIKIDREELIARIASQIGAIEHVEDLKKKYEGVLVAQVLEKSDHPNADKLGVYRLDIGSKEVQVVAGDKTLQKGDKVGYFSPETKVSSTVGTADEIVVKKVDLRGIESEGMMASEREIDLGTGHKEVMRLDTPAKPGTPFAQAYEMDDLVIDVENKALANRGDCFGIIGLAREISGIQGLKFETPVWLTENYERITQEDRVPIIVRNEAGMHCPRYMAIVMDSVKVKTSPIWLKSILNSCGVRPVNNIVDITNYLMLLTSQPLHAFDYDKIIGKDSKSKNIATIVVRPSKTGEKITTLDGKTVELSEGVTVIADSDNPIAIAGIMGGQDTEIDENTTRIIIECANFDRYNIRRSSMKLGLFTEGATRFTKALDPMQCEMVLAQTVKMVGEIAQGKVASLITDDYQAPANRISLQLSVKRANSHLGMELSPEKIVQILENINYIVEKQDDDMLIVHIPSWRKDITLVEDIHEDIGRQYGYNNIKIELPTRTILPPIKNKEMDMKNRIRQTLSGNGLNEILTYNFTGKKSFADANMVLDSAYHIKNALSPELEYMRYSLLPSILEKAVANEKAGHQDFGLYEINVGHSKEEIDDQNLPLERWMVSSIIPSNLRSPYYLAKLYTDILTQQLGLKPNYQLLADSKITELPAWIQRISGMFDLNRSAVLYIEGKQKIFIGLVGEAQDSVIKAFGLKSQAAIFEIDITALMSFAQQKDIYREPSRFPAVVQDLCFAVEISTPYEQMKREIEDALNDETIIAKVTPIDIYRPEKENALKQITFRVTLQHTEKTLQPKDIQSLRDKVIKKVSKKFSAQLV